LEQIPVEVVDVQQMNREKVKLYSQVFNTPAGREVVKDMMNFCGFFGDTFQPHDPYQTSYNCGKRRVMTRILNFIGAHDGIELSSINQEGDNNV
jgi:hypothetical protein